LRLSSSPRPIRLSISCAVNLVTIGLQNVPPSSIVADHQILTGLTFGNQNTAVVCIVIDIRDVCDREVEWLKVLQAGRITANNDIVWYAMSALRNPPCNPPECFFGRRKPQEDQGQAISGVSAFQQCLRRRPT